MENNFLEPEKVVGLARNIVEGVSHCSGCGCDIVKGRAKRRKDLGLPSLCKTCAEANSAPYIGKDIGGDLVKTRSERSKKYILHKGHALQ